jgi:hypothetical protein
MASYSQRRTKTEPQVGAARHRFIAMLCSHLV